VVIRFLQGSAEQRNNYERDKTAKQSRPHAHKRGTARLGCLVSSASWK